MSQELDPTSHQKINSRNFWRSKEFIFAIALWLLSRLVIVGAMIVIAPVLPPPSNGVSTSINWEMFSYWDSHWYEKIATLGYEYAPDGEQHSVAFFPLFPLVVRGLMLTGLPFSVAGTLVNNLAFLGALLVLYYWVRERHGISTARWTTAALAWCPLSLFTTVAYTEGLFLLLSVAALRCFDHRQHGWAALWGAMASAVRVTGIALLPAFLIVAWRERRAPIAYATGLATSGGILLFSLYCAIRFSDPLAFIHAQRGWRSSSGFALRDWLKFLIFGSLGGRVDSSDGFAQELLHLILCILLLGSGYLLWRLRHKFKPIAVASGLSALTLLLERLTWWGNGLFAGGDIIIKIVMVLGGGYLLWRFRSRLSFVAVAYGFFSMALILNTGIIQSIERYAYAIVPLAIALGLFLTRYPYWVYPLMTCFGILLINFAIRFSQRLFVA